MSFANKFSFIKKPGTPGKGGNGDGKQETKTKAKVRQHPLMSAKHGEYVDDSELYRPKISRTERNEYWLQLMANRGKRALPSGFKSWMSKEIATSNEITNYPLSATLLFNITSTCNWDQRTLNLFLIFILVAVTQEDGWAELYLPGLLTINADYQLLGLLLLGMFLCQIIPVLGMLYLVNYCNDLVLYKASSGFQTWAFNAALTAQYIEFFYYGGRDQRDRAGNCRFGHTPNNQDFHLQLKRYAARVAKRHAAVHPAEGAGKQNDEEDEDEDDDNDGSEVDSNGQPTQKRRRRRKKWGGTDIESGAADSESEEEEDEQERQRKDSAALLLTESLDTNGRGGEGEEQTSRGGGGGLDREDSLFTSAADGDGGEQQGEEKDEEQGESAVEYLEWTCVVCRRENRAPRHPAVIDRDIIFGTKGVYYKRTYAVIQPRRDMPECAKCMTYADYKPPQSSAHRFPHNPEPHTAFENYPKPSVIPYGLKIDENSVRYNAVMSFFLGLRNSVTSTPVLNDWRLRKYVMGRYPEIPRLVLRPGEAYQVGEIIECKQQKFDWVRCRIIAVKRNKSYDIRYDGGDELRFVQERCIRLRPEKRAYAYRVEACMVLIAVLLPLGGYLAVTGSPGLLLLGPLLASVALFGIRAVTFVQFFHNYYAAGLCEVLRTSALYSLPLLFLLITSAVGMGCGAADSPQWVDTAVLLVVTKALSLPVLYMMRPPFALFGLAVFAQTSVGLYLLSLYVTGVLGKGAYIAIPLAPLFSATLSLKLLRRNLHTIWDVCLVIRPERDTSKENPSILVKAREELAKVKDDLRDLAGL